MRDFIYDFFEFTFRGFWTFIGMIILIGALGGAISEIIYALAHAAKCTISG